MGSTQQEIIIAEKRNVVEANNPVRNTGHDYLKFVNSAVFSEEARHFMRYGYYTDAPAGTKDYEDYWEEQDRRCIEGYSVGGVRIPGRYYFMLNFGMMKARPIDPKTGIEYSDRKIWTFPKFLDHQYYIGLELEECFAEGPHVGKAMQGLICLKSRRKGFSYFDSSTVSAYNYNFVPGSTTVLAAFETQYYKVPLDAVHTTLNHLNKYTCWSKRRIINRRDHIKSGFKGYDRNGQEIEDGDLSEFLAVSFKDNPFKSIGESIYAFNGEELGRWPDFLTAYSIAEPTFRDGNIMTGVPILWGCICKGSKVWNKHGELVNIEDLKQEDGIIGYGENGASIENISWMKPPAQKPCYRITTKQGRILECSDDHPILSSKSHMNYTERGIIDGKRVKTGLRTKRVKFVETKLLKKGDQVVIAGEVPIFGDKELFDARLVGMLIGDGSYGFRNTPALSNCDIEINNYIESKYNTSLDKSYITSTGKLFKTIRIKDICPKLREIGIYGQTKDKKTLPKDIYKYSKNSIADLIAGIIDTDGYVSYKKNNKYIVITSAYKNLLIEIKDILVKLGAVGNINGVKPKFYEGKRIQSKNIEYRLTISDKNSLINLYKNITLLCKYKQEAFDGIYNEIKDSYISNSAVLTGRNPDNKNFVYLTNIPNIKFETVESVEYIGYKDVYNLTADNTHTYIANGIITHNSAADIEVGSVGLEEMFYNPSAYGLKGYENIYDDNASGKCGYFIDDLWYYPDKVVKKHFINGKEQTTILEGVDVNGNSIREVAYDSLMEKRNLRARGDRHAYNKFISQQPLKPSEAFLRVEGNRFDVTRAQARLAIIESNRAKYINSIQCVDLELNGNNVVIVPDLIHPPLREFPLKDNINKPGVIEIFEEPVIDKETGKAYRNRYIAGTDSYDKDYSTTNSVGSTFILDLWTDRLVAQYKGRPEANKFYEKVRRLLMLYNATSMYERTNIAIYTYFYNAGSAYLLADEPEILAQKGLVKPMPIGNNRKGCPMPEGVKALGLELFEMWLVEKAYEQPEVKEGEDPIILSRYDELRSISLLKEIIGWNPMGNFDDISAMLPLMIYREDKKKAMQSYQQKIKTRAEDPFFSRFSHSGSLHPSIVKTIYDNNQAN